MVSSKDSAMKQRYITPSIKVIQLVTDNNIAQFVISSHSVPENGGLAKDNFFEEEDDQAAEETNNVGYNVWED